MYGKCAKWGTIKIHISRNFEFYDNLFRGNNPSMKWGISTEGTHSWMLFDLPILVALCLHKVGD